MVFFLGHLPLSLAIASDNEDTFKYILELIIMSNSTDELKNGINVFGLACFYGKVKITKLLLSLNIWDVNEPGLYGKLKIRFSKFEINLYLNVKFDDFFKFESKTELMLNQNWSVLNDTSVLGHIQNDLNIVLSVLV